MMTVNEVSRLTGVSVRTLQYYDRIGLLPPAARTEAGYRLYDEETLGVLREILLYRELEFPLSDIKKILFSPSYDRREALHEQEKLLEMKKRHIEDLIALTREIAQSGGNNMDFSAFDTSKMDEYAREAKEKWERVVVRPQDFQSDTVSYHGWDVTRNRITHFTIFAFNGTDLWIDDVRLYGINRDDLR